jgi:hypothetical protein
MGSFKQSGENLMIKENLLSVVIFILFVLSVSSVHAQDAFSKFCSEKFSKTGQCPEDICEMKCDGAQDKPDPPKVCLPKDCTQIEVEKCPVEFCAVMKDCSGGQICNYQMVGEHPECGDLSYGGQDIKCCEGFVRRCGVEFLDGSCDMEGKNSVYNIPICIPCGDGICGQFESQCNCPEDCGGGEYKGVKFDAEEPAANVSNKPSAGLSPSDNLLNKK